MTVRQQEHAGGSDDLPACARELLRLAGKLEQDGEIHRLQGMDREQRAKHCWEHAVAAGKLLRGAAEAGAFENDDLAGSIIFEAAAAPSDGGANWLFLRISQKWLPTKVHGYSKWMPTAGGRLDRIDQRSLERSYAHAMRLIAGLIVPAEQISPRESGKIGRPPGRLGPVGEALRIALDDPEAWLLAVNSKWGDLCREFEFPKNTTPEAVRKAFKNNFKRTENNPQNAP